MKKPQNHYAFRCVSERAYLDVKYFEKYIADWVSKQLFLSTFFRLWWSDLIANSLDGVYRSCGVDLFVCKGISCAVRLIVCKFLFVWNYYDIAMLLAGKSIILNCHHSIVLRQKIIIMKESCIHVHMSLSNNNNEASFFINAACNSKSGLMQLIR
jgi:hypothetical protein